MGVIGRDNLIRSSLMLLSSQGMSTLNKLLSSFAGQGPFSTSSPCWTCNGPGCLPQDSYLEFASTGGTTTSATAVVSVPGGGQYRLIYYLAHAGGSPNSFESRIGSVDGSFTSMVLESLTDSPEFRNFASRELPFVLPDGTQAVTLTFMAQQVGYQCGLFKHRGWYGARMALKSCS